MDSIELDFGAHRRRTNTAQKLEKLDLERKRVGKITNIKWEDPTNAAGMKAWLEWICSCNNFTKIRNIWHVLDIKLNTICNDIFSLQRIPASFLRKKF